MVAQFFSETLNVNDNKYINCKGLLIFFKKNNNITNIKNWRKKISYIYLYVDNMKPIVYFLLLLCIVGPVNWLCTWFASLTFKWYCYRLHANLLFQMKPTITTCFFWYMYIHNWDLKHAAAYQEVLWSIVSHLVQE